MSEVVGVGCEIHKTQMYQWTWRWVCREGCRCVEEGDFLCRCEKRSGERRLNAATIRVRRSRATWKRVERVAWADGPEEQAQIYQSDLDMDR